MNQIKEAYDGESVMTAISYLVNNRHKLKKPWWFKPLDYLLTALYLTIYVGVLVMIVRMFL
jgi:hypothetical protein